MHPIEIDATLKLAKRKLREGKVPEVEAAVTFTAMSVRE